MDQVASSNSPLYSFIMANPRSRVSIWSSGTCPPTQKKQPPIPISEQPKSSPDPSPPPAGEVEVARIQRLQHRRTGPFAGTRPRLGPADFHHEACPWEVFTSIVDTEQAGAATIAGSREPGRNKTKLRTVVIKEVRGQSKQAFKTLIRPTDENLVQLHRVYYYDATIYLVYERLDVCLNEALTTPRGRLPLPEIATVCKAILSGLRYVHDTLGGSHGHIDGESVLLSRSGQVKLG